jgi:type VI secretion system Hcp family effector
MTMHSRSHQCAVFLFGLMALCASHAQAQNCYALIEGAGGAPISALSGTVASGHATETEVSSYGFNAYRPVDGSLNPGVVEAQPLRISKFFDGSSPRLLDAFAGGEVLDTFELSCESPGGSPVEITRITLTGATVVGIASGGLAGSFPSETVSFSYVTLNWIDVPSGLSGKVTP